MWILLMSIIASSGGELLMVQSGHLQFKTRPACEAVLKGWDKEPPKPPVTNWHGACVKMVRTESPDKGV